jgi:group I intron endonuclease
MRKVGIYKITSPSGKVYIGQSWNVFHRWADYGKKTAKSQRMLCFSFNKYGKRAHKFELVHELPQDINQYTLDHYEQIYMDAYRGVGVTLLNAREAGSNGKLSEEAKKRVSEALIGKPTWNKGKSGITRYSDQTKAIMSKAHSEGKYMVYRSGDLVGEFISSRSAAKTVGVSFVTIQRLSKTGSTGQFSSAKGLSVIFKNNE